MQLYVSIVMYQNISEWLTVDYLIAYKVLPTASHIFFAYAHTYFQEKSTTFAVMGTSCKK